MADVTIGASLKLDGSDGIKTLKDLKNEIKEAKGDLIAMTKQFGDLSPQAGAAAAKVAELAEHIKDSNKLVEAFNPDTKFRAFGASINTVVGGFSALQGVMGLVGAESEEVQKSLLKVQSALAISQGIAQLQEGVKTFKNLGAVIQQTTLFQKANAAATQATAVVMRLFGASVETTSTSFKVLKGAIVATGIGLLVVLLGEVTSAMQSFASSTDDAATSQEELGKQVSVVNDELAINQNVLKRQESLEFATAKRRGATEKELFDIKQKYRILDFESTKKAYDELRSIDAVAAQEKLRRLNDINNEGKVAQINFDIEEAARQKAAREKAAKEAEEFRKKQLAQALLDRAEETRQRALGITGTLTVGRTPTPEEVDAEARIAASKKQTEQRLVDLETQSDAEADFYTKRKDAERDAILTEQQNYEIRKSIAESSIQLIGAVADLVGRQTAAGKILGIAQATINTFVGASEVLRTPSLLPEPAATISKIANVAAIIATGISAVKNIVKVPLPGGAGGGGGSVPTISQPPLTPHAPGVTTTALDQNSLNQIGNATVRAFVVESDIQNNGERVRRLNRAARL